VELERPPSLARVVEDVTALERPDKVHSDFVAQLRSDPTIEAMPDDALDELAVAAQVSDVRQQAFAAERNKVIVIFLLKIGASVQSFLRVLAKSPHARHKGPPSRKST